MADTSNLTWEDLGLEPPTQADVRRFFDAMSDHIEEWQGLPVILGEDHPLVLTDRHPLRDLYAELGQGAGVDVQLLVDDRAEFPPLPDERVVNSWFSRRENCQVYVIDRDGRRIAYKLPVSPDRSMDRLTMWLKTIGAADAWDLDAEHRARETLRAMLTERQWMHYDLTGSFFETSPRSRLTYVFRRLRPTIAMSPRGKNSDDDTMRCLAVLCMHPIGYYSGTWAGGMVPSDDVIAHLAWVRGDEAGFWRYANQHAPSSPEAGI